MKNNLIIKTIDRQRDFEVQMSKLATLCPDQTEHLTEKVANIASRRKTTFTDVVSEMEHLAAIGMKTEDILKHYLN